MKKYEFTVLTVGGKQVGSRKGFEMSAELQYIADQSWLNCFVILSPQDSNEKASKPRGQVRSMSLDEVTKLAVWTLDKLEKILDSKMKPEMVNNTFWYRKLNRPLREFENNQLPPRFKMLSDQLRTDLQEDSETKAAILDVLGERVPLNAVLGAYSLVRIDQGADRKMMKKSDFWEYFVEAGGALSVGNMAKTGNYLIADGNLESRRKGKQKKGKKSSKTKPYFEPFKKHVLKNASLTDNNKAVSFLRKRSKLPNIDGRPPPSESTLKRWCKEISDQE